ncbi:hypothetical protein [Paractinoplanes rishiriensis]|nr:hypothetical protein [Actinoplanes rishiriensis]
MLRARRLASVAVVASLAVAGLSACRSEPSVVAYLGDTKVTDARVQEVYDEVQEKFVAPPGAPAGQPVRVPISRTDVAAALVSSQVLAQVAKERSVSLPADLQLAEYAGSLSLPENTEYVRLFAETDGYVRVLREKLQNAPEPSDEDLREVFDVLVATEQVNAAGTFEEFKSSLPPQNKQLVQTAAAVRNEIVKAADAMDIRINPRYQPLGIPVLQFQTQNGEVRPLLTAKLGSDEAAPVVDIR